VVGETFFGGLHNFLSIYNIVLTGRILLSWLPQVRRGREGGEEGGREGERREGETYRKADM